MINMQMAVCWDVTLCILKCMRMEAVICSEDDQFISIMVHCRQLLCWISAERVNLEM
jgi:hypothetical protein